MPESNHRQYYRYYRDNSAVNAAVVGRDSSSSGRTVVVGLQEIPRIGLGNPGITERWKPAASSRESIGTSSGRSLLSALAMEVCLLESR